MICKECKETLIEINFKNHKVFVCGNWRCGLHRECQGYRKKEPEIEPKKYPRKKLQPGYSQWLWQKKINYHLLRKRRIPSEEAANVCGNYKRTREILEKVLV